MRKLIIFLILGSLLTFLILEYLAQDQERRQKRLVRAASPQLQPEMAATSTRRQWQGTDEAALQAKDDLTLINGIGPAFEKALNAAGIYTFTQLAEQDPDDLASRLTARITAERIRRDRWIEQARELARGS
jgi:large subunit ribosomal protein L21